MAYLNQNPKDLIKMTTEMSELIKNYDKLIDSFFGSLKKAENIWVGIDATMFLQDTLREKEKYINFSRSLKTYNENLYNAESKIDKTIENNRIE